MYLGSCVIFIQQSFPHFQKYKMSIDKLQLRNINTETICGTTSSVWGASIAKFYSSLYLFVMFVQVELHSSIFLLVSYGLWPANLSIFYFSIQVNPFTKVATFSIYDICSGIAKMRNRTNLNAKPIGYQTDRNTNRKVKYANIAVSRPCWFTQSSYTAGYLIH